MEVFKPIWTIYNLVDRIKNNNEQCPHISERLKALEKLVLFILQMEPDQLSDDVNEALGKLNKVLLSAAELIGEFRKAHVLNQVVKSNNYKLEFDSLNKSLSDAFVTLSGALHAFQGKKLAQQENKLIEQEARIDEQENKLHEQQKKLAGQERKLAEQAELLQRVESKYESRGYYCVLL